ncbi:MAG TPA: hypothetical protein VJ984_01125, partial [Xanthomonadales bacterium]|nr:hypothetical protein [Xanthomonadales bacterium]
SKEMIIRTILLALMLTGTVISAGCERDGPAERAGESIDEAVDEAADAVEDACDEAEDATGVDADC